MTPKHEFIKEHMHEMMGWIHDAKAQRLSGARSAMFDEMIRSKVIARLEQIWNQLNRPTDRDIVTDAIKTNGAKR